MEEKLRMTGIMVKHAVMVKEFVAKINRNGRLVVRCDNLMDPWFFDGTADPEAAIREAMAELGYSEVSEWFNDGGTSYAARYPGKDVLGRRFEAGDIIIRKQRQNLAVT